MTSTTTNPTTETIQHYAEFWNSPPGDSQRALASRVFRPDVTYRAPIGEREGIDGLIALAAELTEHLGAVTMAPRAEPDLHHHYGRLRWDLLRDGETFAAGTDILTFDGDGRITCVTAFVDRPPAGFDPHAHG